MPQLTCLATAKDHTFALECPYFESNETVLYGFMATLEARGIETHIHHEESDRTLHLFATLAPTTEDARRTFQREVVKHVRLLAGGRFTHY